MGRLTLVKQPARAEAHALRALPQVHRLLESAPATQLCARFPRERVAAVVREELALLRAAVLAGSARAAEASAPPFFERVAARLASQQATGLRRVLNATGVVLHTNLGRAPLAPEALAAIGETAQGYSNLEYELASGERGARHVHVEDLLCRLSGAEAALVVNNCAAAVLLALTALGQGGEVLVSRGELIEIGGGFRIPEVIAQSGASLVEVGTTNRTRLADFEQAIGPRTRMILRSHPSNYRIVGFTEQPERTELAELARSRGLVLVEDLGSGSLVDLRRFGLPAEPTVQACVREGGGLVAFSGDKLLGGPQAGIVVGPAQPLRQLRQHPLQRALRIDKLSLAALEATLRLYEAPARPEARVPALRMLAQSREEIARRSRLLRRRLRRVLPGLDCTLRDGLSRAGGGALPGEGLPTALLLLQAEGWSAEALSARLRTGSPALVGRIVAGCLALDLRTLGDDELTLVMQALVQALAPERA
jgi:L-seryl-tRNA(Ser) seleniumtransferase